MGMLRFEEGIKRIMEGPRSLFKAFYEGVMRVEGADDIGNFRVNICIPESFVGVKVAAFQPSWSFLWPLYSCFIKL
jgi:hypothetical protein